MSEIKKLSRVFILMLIMAILYMPQSFGVSKKAAKNDVTLNQAVENTVYVSKIDFDEVLKKAKEHSYDLKIADFNVLISKQGEKGARSEYFPKLNFSAGTEYTKNFRDTRDTTIMSIGDAFVNPYTRYQSILGINLSYNVFDFGVRGNSLKMAKEDTAIKELEELEKLQELNLNVVDTYTKILIASKQMELNKEILALEEKNLELKTRLFKAKEISKTEMNDATAKVAMKKKNISELKSMMSESLNWLSFYTGDQYDIDNLKVADIKRTNFDVSAFQDYTKSITWQIHEKQIKKKELEVKVAKKMNYPKVTAYSRYYLYGSNHSSYAESFDDIGPSNYTIGGSVNMPLFDGMKNSANIQKTKLELQQMQVERDKAMAQFMQRLAVMRSNLMYLNEQIEENDKIIAELSDKEKSVKRLTSKKLASPLEENETKIELLEQKIDKDKNSITAVALTRGIQILTETY